MPFPALLTAMCLYGGPVLMAGVLAWVTYHVVTDHRRRAREVAGPEPDDAEQ